jgi:Na+-translocating ferredoxin:NAD+ oxidoreductase RnfE subunit
MVAKDFGFEGIKLFAKDQAALLMILPPGAFITLGLTLGLLNWLAQRKEAKK